MDGRARYPMSLVAPAGRHMNVECPEYRRAAELAALARALSTLAVEELRSVGESRLATPAAVSRRVAEAIAASLKLRAVVAGWGEEG